MIACQAGIMDIAAHVHAKMRSLALAKHSDSHCIQGTTTLAVTNKEHPEIRIGCVMPHSGEELLRKSSSGNY